MPIRIDHVNDGQWMTGLELNQQFDSFYREHHRWLRGWISRRWSCPQQACDLVQDTFIRVLIKQGVAEIRKPRAHLSSIARNLIIDQYRRRSVEQAYLDAMTLQPEPVVMSAEERHGIIETLLEIDRLLDAMSERGREIFLMAQIDGLSYVEIGRRLGISVNTVRKHFIRAMAQCLALLED